MADHAAEQSITPVKVFLLDDHEVVRRGVHDLLDAEPGLTVIGEAATAAVPTSSPPYAPSPPASPCSTPGPPPA